MGCGSILGDLFYLADSLLDRGANNGWQMTGGATFIANRTPPDDLRAQLYQVYGEGQITEEVFTTLRALADRGQLRTADLAVHRARTRNRSTRQDDPAAANALRGIRSRLAQLTRARVASEQVLANLDARLLDIDQCIAEKEQSARELVKRDEQSARQRLAEKAELRSSRDRLATQAQALRADLGRLDDLRAQLEAKSIELEAVQARSRLSEEMLK